jgi:DNA modification methylase
MDEQFQDIKASLTKFGFVDPIIVNARECDRKLVIVGGHQRCKVWAAMGNDTVPVNYVTLSLKDEKELNIRLNKNSGEWDWDILGNLFDVDDLKEWGFDDSDFFGVEEEDIIEELEGEDSIPDVQGKVKTVMGDLYELGGHRLLCGDSTLIDSVDKLMDGKKADMVFTDPPYGINEKCDRSFSSGTRKAKGNSFDQIKGDENTDVAVSVVNLLLGLKIKKYVIWGANYFCHSLPETAQWLAWDKREEEKERDMNSDIELAWVQSGKKSARIFRHKWKGMIKSSEHGQARVHPTQKPIALAEWCIHEYESGLNILDLFLGSGSTLIACEKTKRKCYGMELDEKYCDVIVKRYVDFCVKNNKPYNVLRNGEDITSEFK